MKFAFVLYEGIEPIDLAAVGVISMGRRVVPSLQYVTVAAGLEPSTFSNGLRVVPDFTFENCPPVDAIIVPGGPGWPEAAKNPEVSAFLQTASKEALLISTCTGAMVLAGAGLLNGLSATTKCEIRPPETSPIVLLARDYPEVDVRRALIVDEGNVVTGGGVSLCIDTILHVIATRIGREEADEIARLIEYGSAWRANQTRLSSWLGGRGKVPKENLVDVA